MAEGARELVQEDQDALDEDLARARDRLAREGGTLAKERAKLEDERTKAAAEVATAEERLRSLIAGLLPFAIAQGLADDVADRLGAEQAAEEDEIIARRIKAAGPRLKNQLEAKSGGSVSAAILEQLEVSTDKRPPRRHDVSAADRAVMLEQLQTIRDDVRADAVRLSKQLRRAQDKRERAESRLAEVPDDDALSPIVQEIHGIEHRRGQLVSEMERAGEELREAEHDLRTAERELRKIDEKARKTSKGNESAKTAVRTVRLLEEYGERTEVRRLAQIELEAARYFNRLSRKGELLSRITINRDSFRIRVVRWDQTELPKERLSAGEKQLLAIAILWALAKASQRPLPVVVDTPLARLDAEHRRRLLTEYLPNVSHQVVVLSTDTEVDLAAAAELEAVTARRVFLSHDLEHAATAVAEGYFSPTEGAVSNAG